MISIEYKHKNIKVNIGEIPSYIPTPLTLKIVNPISKEVAWEVELDSNSWANYPNTEIYNALVYDSNKTLLWEKSWSVQEYGFELYKKFYYYILSLKSKGIKPKGVAIGTHDGAFGEWVPLVIFNLTEATLVEASNNQFKELEKNYSKYKNEKLLNLLVTKDGKPTPFWEGGKGYTNSIVKRVPEAQEIEPINPTVYPSININKLINDKTDWLHLDVEGYDHILIKSLKNLPNCIIFEWENLLTEELKDIKNFLTNKGYKLDFENNVSCLALKTN